MLPQWFVCSTFFFFFFFFFERFCRIYSDIVLGQETYDLICLKVGMMLNSKPLQFDSSSNHLGARLRLNRVYGKTRRCTDVGLWEN